MGGGGGWAGGKGRAGGIGGSDYQGTANARGVIYTTTDRVRACVVSREKRSILLLVRTRYYTVFGVCLRAASVAWIYRYIYILTKLTPAMYNV